MTKTGKPLVKYGLSKLIESKNYWILTQTKFQCIFSKTIDFPIQLYWLNVSNGDHVYSRPILKLWIDVLKIMILDNYSRFFCNLL